jgi:hypothetical protein
LGVAVTHRFPFLAWKPLKTWHYRQQMLEAIALGIVATEDLHTPPQKGRSLGRGRTHS